jgi:tetratricopeptide (TPR) repeat protein
VPSSLPTSLVIGGGVAAAMTLPLLWFFLHRRRHSAAQVGRLLRQRRIVEACWLLVELGRPEEAVERLLSERRLAEAARVHMEIGDYGRAAELLTRIGDHEAAAAAFRRNGDRSEAAKALERSHRYEDAGDLYVTVQQMRNAARMYRKAGEYKKAGDILHQLGETHRGAYLLGIHYTEAGELDKAGRCFLRAGKLKRAGAAFSKAGDFLNAAKVFDRLGEPGLAAEARGKAGGTLAAAETLERAGELARAIPLYEAAGQWNKVVALHKRLQNWAALGNIMVSLDKEDLAVEFFRRVKPQDEGHVESTMSLAALLERRGDIDEAIQKYSEILNFHGLGGSTSAALIALTALCERTNRSRDAVMPQAAQPRPEVPRTPEPAVDGGHGASPGTSRLLEKVELAVQAKRYKKARALLEKGLKANPEDITALFRLSDLHCQLGARPAAVSVLADAAAAYRERGVVLLAATVLERLLGLDGDRWELHGDLADLYVRLGRGVEAEAQYKIQLRGLLARGRTLEALHVVRRILAMTPGAVQDRARLAEAFSRHRQFEDAAREFRTILSSLDEGTAQDPQWIEVAERYLHHGTRDAQVAQQLAERLIDLGRHADAMLWLRLCFDESPGDVENLDMLATCFEGLGQPGKAVAVLKILASLHGQRGLKAEQESTLSRILECDPEEPSATRALGRADPAETLLKGQDIELSWELP